MQGEKIQMRDGWALGLMLMVVAGLFYFCGSSSSASPPPPQIVYRSEVPHGVAVTPAPVQSEPRIIYVNSGGSQPPAVNINNVVHLANDREQVPIMVKQGQVPEPQQPPSRANTVNYARRDPRCEQAMDEYNKFVAETDRRQKLIIEQQ